MPGAPAEKRCSVRVRGLWKLLPELRKRLAFGAYTVNICLITSQTRSFVTATFVPGRAQLKKRPAQVVGLAALSPLLLGPVPTSLARPPGTQPVSRIGLPKALEP